MFRLRVGVGEGAPPLGCDANSGAPSRGLKALRRDPLVGAALVFGAVAALEVPKLNGRAVEVGGEVIEAKVHEPSWFS